MSEPLLRVRLASVADLPDPARAASIPTEQGATRSSSCGAAAASCLARRLPAPRRHADGLAQGRLPERRRHAHRLSRARRAFDMASGVCLLGPCLGQRLIAVPIEVTEDGYVVLVRHDTRSIT
jgi:hypothetical protein